ncbi:hypothetical protein [Chryseobacterium aurantiacum]|nr:hypothetical protein [Chryseobacterium aurantiacum]
MGIANGVGEIFQIGSQVANSLGSTWTIAARAGAKMSWANSSIMKKIF